MTLDPNQDRRTQIRTMLDACVDYAERLTRWEKDFVESINEQFEASSKLSDKQVDKLEAIYIKLP